MSPLQYFGRFQTEAWSTNPEANTTSPTVYVFETYRATLSEEATWVLEQQVAEQHPPMALVKSMKEIESIIANGGRCSDGTPYSVSKDTQNVQPRLITQDELPLLDVFGAYEPSC